MLFNLFLAIIVILIFSPIVVILVFGVKLNIKNFIKVFRLLWLD